MRLSRSVWRSVMGVFFIVAGLNHFRNRDLYISIMPPYLAWHGPLVDLSGIAEVVLGALVLVPQYARLAGWGLMALLVAVFPANVHMTVNAEQYAKIPAWLLWLRLPLQGVLIAWVDWCTRSGREIS